MGEKDNDFVVGLLFNYLIFLKKKIILILGLILLTYLEDWVNVN